MERGFAVIGLGYVGLPVALAARDATGEVSEATLHETTLRLTDDADALNEASFFIVTVPTPINAERRPDLSPLEGACSLIGRRLRPGAVVVFESTVYPGLTREFCGPLLATASGLKQGVDFKLGYSPERINPGDQQHRLETIVKIVAGEDEETLERVAGVYGRIIEAGIYRASSLEVAEAAKVIENTQRDLNIALMNELAIIFDRLNDGMGGFIAQRLVKLLIAAERPVKSARIGIVGITFKEDVPDLRNSRVPDIVTELREFGITASVADPLADPGEAKREYGIDLVPLEVLTELDGLILAVPHKILGRAGWERLFVTLSSGGVFIDVKSVMSRDSVPKEIHYWSL